LSITPERVWMCEPPSSFLSTCVPMPARSTTGGPPAITWLLPLTMTEKCAQAALTAPSPAQGPSAIAATGITPICFAISHVG
jgi:hypothetical protein